MFQGAYILFGFKFSRQGESRKAVNEWIATVNNKKKYAIMAEKIDKIIDLYT